MCTDSTALLHCILHLSLHFVFHYKCFFLPFIVRHTHRPDIVCDQPREPWHLDYPQNLGWGSYYSIHLLVGNKLCRHPDLLCMLIYFSQSYSWLIGLIYIVIDTLTKSQTRFTASAVLIVTIVIFRLIAFCFYLGHISVRRTISCHRHNPPIILNLGSYWCLMFTFTGYWYICLQVASCQFIMRSVIFQTCNSDRVQDALLSCAVENVWDC